MVLMALVVPSASTTRVSGVKDCPVHGTSRALAGGAFGALGAAAGLAGTSGALPTEAGMSSASFVGGVGTTALAASSAFVVSLGASFSTPVLAREAASCRPFLVMPPGPM
ncbi:Uncharacterised protein [Mycobacteroides abscessus subsp. abscessus]|nr:Uncharacterised protein [Mycobacteroides abscessus subsp. abscessus]